MRIHIDEQAAGTAERLGARAVTVGSHIFFNRNAVAPGTAAGDRLLVHELTHVVQHDEGRMPQGRDFYVTSPSDAVEREAKSAEGRATQLGALPTGAPRAAAAETSARAPRRDALAGERAKIEAVEARFSAPSATRASSGARTPKQGSSIAGDWRSSLGAAWTEGSNYVSHKVDQAEHVVADTASSVTEAAFRALAPAWMVEFVLGPGGPVGYIERKLQALLEEGVAALTKRFGGILNLGRDLLSLASAFESAFEILSGGAAKQQACCDDFKRSLQVIRDFGTKLVNNPAVAAIRKGFAAFNDALSWLVRVVGGRIFDFFKAAIPAAWSVVVQIEQGFTGLLSMAAEKLGAIKDWLLDKLASLGLDLRGGGGILSWIENKLSALWARVKAAFNLDTLKEIATAIVAVSPLGPILYLVTHFKDVVAFVEDIAEIWKHRNDPAFLRNVGATGGLRNKLLKMFADGTGLMAQLGAALGSLKDWVVDKFGRLENAIGRGVAALQASAWFKALGGFLATVRNWVKGLYDWAASHVMAAVGFVKRIAAKVGDFIQPYIGLLESVATAIIAPMTIPALIAAWYWKKLDPCVKEPIVDLLLDAMIGFTNALPQFALFGPLWSMMRQGFLGFLRGVRKHPKRVAMFDGLAQMLLQPANAAGNFVKGFVVGIVDNLVFPLEAIWMGIKAVMWVGGLLERLGQQTKAPRPAQGKVDAAAARGTSAQQGRAANRGSVDGGGSQGGRAGRSAGRRRGGRRRR